MSDFQLNTDIKAFKKNNLHITYLAQLTKKQTAKRIEKMPK